MIAWHHELQWSPDMIAVAAGVHVQTVQRILKLDADYGTIQNPYTCQHSRKRILDMSDMDFLAGLLDASPSLFLDEIQDALSDTQDIDISVATISCTIAHLS
jgi:hypothetical protein